MGKFSLLLLGIFISCQGKSNQEEKQLSHTFETKQEATISNDTINGAIGIIVPSESYEFGDSIKIYDGNQKLLTTIIRTDENQIIALMCLAQGERFYQIKFDDEQVGYIPNESKQIVFQSWEEHILDVFSVDFDTKANPLRKEPVEDSNTLYFDEDEFYHPNQIKDEWLQVKWGGEGNWNYGWIKWKDGGKLLIKLYYFA
jgi:hypothetical protein